ncbi:MAG: ABC transporter permease [Vicinamibacterales bacterium]
MRRLLDRLLRLAYRDTAGDVVAGDLEEEFHAIRAGRGEKAAQRWYRRQALRSILASVHHRRQSTLETECAEPKGDGFMHTSTSDLRYAARMLLRRPAFTAATLTALAIGLGANAAMFSVIDAVLLRPLPYSRAETLVVLEQVDHSGSSGEPGLISPATFLDWRDAATSYQDMATVRPWSFTDTTSGEPEVLPAGLVSAGLFDLLGVAPAAGRLLIPQDYEQGAPRVAVMSDRLWRSRFGADPGLVGRTIRFEDAPVTIVGILPAAFHWLDQDQLMWAPYVLSERARTARRQTFLRTVARLKSGVTVDQARAEASVVTRRLIETAPDVYRTVSLQVTPIDIEVTGEVRPALAVLFGAVGLILLIACANVASLMLARSAERQREFSVRAAIGAGPGRLARQLLVESLLISFIGAGLGLLVAYVSLDTIVALTPGEIPRLDQTGLNWRVLAFSAGLAIAVAALIGTAPALHARRDVVHALRATAGAGHGQSTRLRLVFVAAEVAICFVLLIGAGLLVQSFVRLTRVDPGFRTHNVVTLETLVWSTFPKPDQQRLFFAEVLDRLRALPGVVSAGGVTALPFLGSNSIEMDASVSIVGDADSAATSSAFLSITTLGYFETMGISLLHGRTFDQRDNATSTPVAIVSEGFARRRLGADSVGRSIVVKNDRTPGPLQVIGVVGDVRHVSLDSSTRDEVFIPQEQSPFGSLSLVVRTQSDPLLLVPSMKAAIRSVYPAQTFGIVATLDELVALTVAPRRFYLVLAVMLAGTALLLAMVGLYGVTTLLAAQRTREIGVRLALGGTRHDILRLVLRTGLTAPIIGGLVGVIAAVSAAQMLRAYLFGIEPTDASTFAAVTALVVFVSLVAAYVPAHRALRVDPVVALRDE